MFSLIRETRNNEEIKKRTQSSISEIKEGECLLETFNEDKNEVKNVLTLMNNSQEKIEINENYKRENRFLTTKEIDTLNKIRSQSYQPNKVYQIYLDSLENNASERLMTNIYGKHNEYSDNDSQGVLKHSYSSLPRELEKGYLSIQPTSNQLFQGGLKIKEKYYQSESNHTHNSNQNIASNRQIYYGIDNSCNNRRYSFSGNETTPIMHLKLSELQPEVVSVFHEDHIKSMKASIGKSVHIINKEENDDFNKENIKYIMNKSPPKYEQF